MQRDTPPIPVPVYYFSLTTPAAEMAAEFVQRHGAPAIESFTNTDNQTGKRITIIGPIDPPPFFEDFK